MTSLTVWCSQDPPPLNCERVVLWGAFLPDGAPKSWISLPQQIYDRRDSLRAEYLEWLHELGMTTLRRRPLRDRLMIRPTLSYWWMTVPACHSMDRNSPVYDTVRLLELERVAEAMGADAVELKCPPDGPSGLLRTWARSSGRAFKLATIAPVTGRPAGENLGQRVKDFVLVAFPPLGALAALLAIGKQGGNQPSTGAGDKEALVMIDYLAHLDKDSRKSGSFASNYWGPLVNVVEEQGPTTWLHLSANRPKRSNIATDVQAMNEWTTPPHTRHELLHAGASAKVKARAFRDYLRVARMGILTTRKRKVFYLSRAKTTVWPTFKKAYRDEWFGATAMLNCLYLNLLEDYFTNHSPARLGIYLFENQPWEMALIHAWKSAGHGTLIGVAHSTVLFWNTRIFKDPRDIRKSRSYAAMRWPDSVAVNGPAMRSMFEEGGFDPSLLVDAEALRYLGLAKDGQQRDPSVKRVLLLGEYSWSATAHMIATVEAALAIGDLSVSIVFRQHPATSPTWTETPRWLALDASESITDALRTCDAVICGPMTSASVEAALSGRWTLLLGDGEHLTCSPAETLHAAWALSPEDLHRLLSSRRQQPGEPAPSSSVFFYLDQDLSRWKCALSAEG